MIKTQRWALHLIVYKIEHVIRADFSSAFLQPINMWTSICLVSIVKNTKNINKKNI